MCAAVLAIRLTTMNAPSTSIQAEPEPIIATAIGSASPLMKMPISIRANRTIAPKRWL